MSDDVQRLVRKLQPKGPRSFDEQSWPIYVAIIVLCGFLSGVVLSILNFNDERLHANALLWLGVVIAAGCLGLWSVSLLQNAIVKRTLVLSLLLSLIINLSLLMMMAWTWIFSSAWNEEQPRAVAQRKKQDVVVPEYPIFNDKQQQRVPQEYERPVETGEPDAEQRVELTRQSTQPNMQPSEPTLTASSAPDQPTSSQPRRSDAPSAPRQNEQLAKLSRQPLRADLNISRKPQAQPIETQATPSEAEASTTVSKATPSKQSTFDTPDLPVEEDVAPQKVETTALARRTETQPDDTRIASLPTLQRKLNRPTKVPKTATPVASRSSESQKVKESLEANSTLLAKRTTTAPEQMERTELQPKVSTSFDRRSRIDQPENETLSPTVPKASLSKSNTPDIKVDTPTENPSPTESDSQEPTATASQIARRETSVPTEAQTNAPTATAKADLAPSAQAIARAISKTDPSISTNVAADRSLTRANKSARVATSTKAEVASTVEAASSESTPSPASEPSRMSLSRSSVGIAGVGNAANLERGVAAPEVPINVASASANRARATQDTDPGPALSPSKPSLTRRLRATSESPSTSMQAQPIDSAMVAGANAPAAEASSSSATMERASSNALAAPTTAAKGTTEVDLGPTRIATDTGRGRAEGGGQPEIITGERPRALPRENSLAGKTGIRTDTDAPNATAPAAQDTAATASQTATATGAELTRSSEPATTATASGGSSEPTADEVGQVRVARAGGQRSETTSSDEAPSLAAGGTSSPGRTSRSLQIKTATNSELPSLASLEASDGLKNGDPLDAQGAKPRQSSAGLLVENTGEVGAEAADTAVDGTPGSLPSPTFSRGGESGSEPSDMLAMSDRNLGATRKNRRVNISGSSTNVELDPEDFAANLPGSNVEDALEGGDGIVMASTTERSSGGGSLMVDVDAPDGDGGLGDTPSIDAGIVARLASDDSELVSLQPSRFLRRTRPGASVATKTDVATPTKAFRRRIIRKGEELAGERGLPSPKTEAAIELGLVFLSRFQSADGSWSFNNFADGKAELPTDEDAIMVSDSAATGLALLSYLGAGYHHKADKYQERVKGGVDFLVQHQKEDGDLYIDQDPNSSRSAWLYSHAIATIALCEAYGMTQDPELRPAAQKAINFIVEAQHPSRGGWRYSPAYGSDTSVSGWMTMAMKSAELADLTVPKSIYGKIARWLDTAQASDAQPYLYRYNPYAPDTEQQRHGRKATRAITSVGLLMRLYTGWKRTDANMILGATTLAQNPPELGTSSRPRRDTYYWYYATQVMFHMGGDYWSNWNRALHPMLDKSQVKDGPLSGSWNPQTPIPDRWGSYGGRLYVTTLNLLSLEVFYRHLPLYEETSK